MSEKHTTRRRYITGKLIQRPADLMSAFLDSSTTPFCAVDNRGEDIQKVVAAWFDVVKFIQQNETEAVQIMAKVVEQKPEDYRSFLPGTRFFDLKANLNAFEKREDNSSLYGSGKTIGQFLQSVEMIKDIPDHASAIEPRFVRAVKE